MPALALASSVPAMTMESEKRSWWRFLGSLPFVVAVLVACNALYIGLVAFGNITDYDTNYAFVQHVLSMDTTNFGAEPGTGLDPDVMWRSISDPVLWNVGYIAIIVWESVAAIVLIAALVLWVRSFVRRGGYETPKAVSSIGLLMILVLFFAGFVDVGGEWFSMWRSTAWNGLDTAFRNGMFAAVTLILMHVTSQAWVRKVDVRH